MAGRMNRILAAIAIPALLASSAVGAESLRIPPVRSGEVNEYRVSRNGMSERDRAFFVRTEEITESYTVRADWKRENGGLYLVDKRVEKKVGGHQREWTFKFKADRKLVFDSYNMVTRSPAGKILERRNGRPWFAGKAAPADLVHFMSASLAVRGFDLGEGGEWSYHSWTPQNEQLDRIIVSVEGRETITVPAGTYSTYRVALRIDMHELLGRWKGLEFLIKPLVPYFTLWIGRQPSKPLVRFRGKFGPGKSATVDHELVR